jgi:CubicO group peptidase (beta-lactamase class C family)
MKYTPNVDLRLLSIMRLRIIAMLVIATSAQAQQKDPATAFDAYTAQAFKDWGAVGLAVAVVKDGKVVFAKGYGVRELGKPATVDTNTRFSIGSTTKAMTAAALGMLVDDGKVRWDDPVTKHLPWFQLSDPYATREITVRDLLTHRGGLGNADFLWYQSDNTPEDVLRLIRYARPAYSFRSGWIYQNVMYAVAGALVGAASGMSWEDFIRTRIFAPLDMRASVPTLAGTVGQPNVAAPHDKVKGTVQVIENASVDQVNAAGSVWSSVADMAKWMRFMIDSGRIDGKALLKPGTWNELLTPGYALPNGFYPSAQLTKPKFNTYALGWFQHDYVGRRLNYHTGSIDGMVAIIGIIPEERFGVYVLGNLDHVEVRHALLYKAIDTWLGTGTRDWSTDLRVIYNRLAAEGDSAQVRMEARRIKNTKASLPLEQYAGTYVDSLYGKAVVTYESGALRLRTSSKQAGNMAHWQYDTFRVTWDAAWRGGPTVTFVLGADGRPAELRMSGGILRRR